MVKLEEANKTKRQVAHSLIAGSVAGMTTKTIVAPIERIKIIYQAKDIKPFSFKDGIKTVDKIIKYSGWQGLWRGNTASLLHVAPYSAIQFAVHEQLKDLFGVRTYEQNLQKPFHSFLTGALSGLVATTLTYPLDVARARMATDYTYKNIYEVIKRSVRSRDHKLGLYRGFTPAVIGLVPYSGGSFLIYELFKTRYFAMASKKGTKNHLSLAIEKYVKMPLSTLFTTSFFP